MSAPPSSRATTPLLELVQRQALDADYATVAARREAAGAPHPGGGGTWRGVVVLVAVGALLAVAIQQTSRDAVASQSGRAALIAQIEENRADLSATQERIGDLKAAIGRQSARMAGLETEAAQVDADLTRLGVRTGSTPVVGEGVRIKVDDSPSGLEVETVRADDLALLVDGLWAAGAEAIAVNGQRLTALSYLSNSGPVVHVNSRPLSAPYVVEAIGDTRTLQAELASSPSGARFADLARALGFQVTRQNVDELHLPGARLRPLRDAATGEAPPKPVDEGGTP